VNLLCLKIRSVKPRTITYRGLPFLVIFALFAGTLAAQGDQSGKRVEAEKSFEEGVRLYKEGSKESLERARQKLEDVHPIFHAQNRALHEAASLYLLGSIYSLLGQRQKALDSYELALPIFRSIRDAGGEADTLANIGEILSNSGENERALAYLGQALPLYRAVGDRQLEATILTNIGVVYGRLGEKQKALDNYWLALPLRRAVGDSAGEAATLNNIGNVYVDLGERQKALDNFWLALPLHRAVGDRTGEAATLNNIGAVYSALGEKQKALDNFGLALSLLRAVGDRRHEATALTNIGQMYSDLGEKQKALDNFLLALSLRREVGDRAGEGETLNNIGTVYSALGEKQKALDNYGLALKLFRGVADRQGEAITLSNIGVIYDDRGEEQRAIETYGLALPLLRAVGDRDGEATTLSNLARVKRKQGLLDEARVNLEAAIPIIESLRTKVTNQESRASYFATKQDYYEFYIDILMRLQKQRPNEGGSGAALQVSERARARSLLETLGEGNADIRQGVDAALVQRERDLQQRLNATAQSQMKLLSIAHTREQANVVAGELEALTTEYQQVETQIRQKSPRYAALTQPQPLSLKEIQTQVLDADTLLLEYSLGEERSYLWAVTPTSITSYELPKRDEIEVSARRVYDLLNARNKRVKGETKTQWQVRVEQADKETPAAAAELSRMVLAPVTAELGKKRLVIVADGVLQYIPFASLPVPDARVSASGKPATDQRLTADKYQPLIVEHEIVSLPSASTLAVLRREVGGRPPAPKMLVALADPVFARNDTRVKGSTTKTNGAGEEPKRAGTESVRELQLVEAIQNTGVSPDGLYVPRLPGTRREAEEIIALVPPSERKLALDFAASRETASSTELSQYRYVHFSTHGFLNSVHPELSGLVFSLVNERGEAQDGFLRAHEVFNLKLPAELVVLSACQTGIGKEVKGEGLVSLTRGFMYAGAPRVVVSLWSVSEMGTTELMVRFYREMLKEGKPPAAALRAAQISLMKEKRWASPFYWAPFVVQGEWR